LNTSIGNMSSVLFHITPRIHEQKDAQSEFVDDGHLLSKTVCSKEFACVLRVALRHGPHQVLEDATANPKDVRVIHTYMPVLITCSGAYDWCIRCSPKHFLGSCMWTLCQLRKTVIISRGDVQPSDIWYQVPFCIRVAIMGYIHPVFRPYFIPAASNPDKDVEAALSPLVDIDFFPMVTGVVPAPVSHDNLLEDPHFLRFYVVAGAWLALTDPKPLYTHCFLQLTTLLKDAMCVANYSESDVRVGNVSCYPTLKSCLERNEEHLKRHNLYGHVCDIALDMTRVLLMKEGREIRYGCTKLQHKLFELIQRYRRGKNHVLSLVDRVMGSDAKLADSTVFHLHPCAEIPADEMVRLSIADYSTHLDQVTRAVETMQRTRDKSADTIRCLQIDWCLPNQVLYVTRRVMGKRWCAENVLCAVPVHDKKYCMRTMTLVRHAHFLQMCLAIYAQPHQGQAAFDVSHLKASALFEARDNLSFRVAWRIVFPHHASADKVKSMIKSAKTSSTALFKCVYKMIKPCSDIPMTSRCLMPVLTGGYRHTSFLYDLLKKKLGEPTANDRVDAICKAFARLSGDSPVPPHVNPVIYPLVRDVVSQHMVFMNECFPIVYAQEGQDALSGALFKEALDSIQLDDVPGISHTLIEEAQQVPKKKLYRVDNPMSPMSNANIPLTPRSTTTTTPTSTALIHRRSFQSMEDVLQSGASAANQVARRVGISPQQASPFPFSPRSSMS
jgi:hypothetical protein